MTAQQGLDNEPSRRSRTIPWSVLPWLALAAIPALMHLAYGIRDTALVEEWPVSMRFDLFGPVPWTPFDEAWRTQDIRPLTIFPHSIAFILDSNSFVWYHVLQALALAAKAVAMFSLLTSLRFRRESAAVAALVFALLPAWDTLFVFRTLHIQFSVVFFLVALRLLVAHYQHRTWATGVGCAASVTVSLLFYEGGYIAVAVAPLVLLLLSRKPWRHAAPVLAVWYLMPFLNGLRIIQLMRSGRPLYQEVIIAKGPRRPVSEVSRLVNQVVGDGLTSFHDPPWGFRLGLVTVVAIGLAAIPWVWWRRTGVPTGQEEDHLSPRVLVIVMLVAIVLAPIVALVFWPQPELLKDSLRIFSFASVCFGFFVVATLHLMHRWDNRSVIRGAPAVVAAALVVTTLAAATAQRHKFHNDAVFEENALGAIVQASYAAPPSNTIVVVDPEHLTGTTVYRIIPETMYYAVSYLLGREVNLHVCRESLDVLRQDAPADLPGTVCRVSPEGIRLGKSVVPFESATVVMLRSAAGPEDGWTGAPHTLPTHRLRNILRCVGNGTCDDGPEGVQARLLDAASLAAQP